MLSNGIISTRWGGRSWVLLGALLVQTSFAAQILVPTDQPTIQAAIDAAAANDVVMVEPGTYNEDIVLKSDVDLRGREAARTFIGYVDQGTAIQANAVTGVLLANFTIISAAIGIEVINSSNIQIANNVFDRLTQFGISVDVDSNIDILHNVFWQNDAAIFRASENIPVTNNIFAGNSRTITGPLLPILNPNTNVENNCFFDNADLKDNDIDTGLGSNPEIGDPLFVDADSQDFHLRQNSRCIDAGTGADDVIDNTIADIGAYGGAFADARPYPLAAPSLASTSVASPPAYNIDVSWDANLAYLVTNTASPGSYRVYYQQNNSGPPYSGGDAGGGTQPSPIEAGDNTTWQLGDLQPSAPGPPAPQLLSADSRSQSIVLTWSAATGASAYRVHYGIDSIGEHQVDAGNVTSFTVNGLQNDVAYLFAVSGLAQSVYHIAVTALDNTPVRNESVFSDESTIMTGPFFAGATSNELTATPAETIPYPDLPDKGCFVATAAFGADWTAEVQVLQDLRDRYLLVNRPGRTFVDWYYTYGPIAADFIDEYAFLKPIVRLLLVPFVIFALFMVTASPLAKVLLATLLMLFTGTVLLRRLRLRQIIAPRPAR
jgi:hypothetical protein